jgi:hypothetical protein
MTDKVVNDLFSYFPHLIANNFLHDAQMAIWATINYAHLTPIYERAK